MKMNDNVIQEENRIVVTSENLQQGIGIVRSSKNRLIAA
jgi:hypothetical protein